MPTSSKSSLSFSSPLRTSPVHVPLSPLALYQVRGLVRFYVTSLRLRRGVTGTSPNPQAGGPLFGCPRLPIRYIRSYPTHWRPLFYPQPKVAPNCGEMDPLITEHQPNCWSNIRLKLLVTEIPKTYG